MMVSKVQYVGNGQISNLQPLKVSSIVFEPTAFHFIYLITEELSQWSGDASKKQPA